MAIFLRFFISSLLIDSSDGRARFLSPPSALLTSVECLSQCRSSAAAVASPGCFARSVQLLRCLHDFSCDCLSICLPGAGAVMDESTAAVDDAAAAASGDLMRTRTNVRVTIVIAN